MFFISMRFVSQPVLLYRVGNAQNAGYLHAAIPTHTALLASHRPLIAHSSWHVMTCFSLDGGENGAAGAKFGQTPSLADACPAAPTASFALLLISPQCCYNAH
jgi:hypothetical protein